MSDADPAVANDQAIRLFSVYRSNGELPALIDAIALLYEAVAVTPDGHPDHAMYLSNLGTTLAALFGHTGDMQALAEAIQVRGKRSPSSPTATPTAPRT